MCAKSVPESEEREERALEASGGDGDTEETTNILRREMRNLFTCFSKEFFSEDRHSRLADGATGSLPSNAFDAVIFHEEIDREGIAATDVRFPARHRRFLEAFL